MNEVRGLGMLAIVLYLLFGSRAAVAELLAELLIGLAALGGGGGKRVGLVLRLLLARLRSQAAPA